MSTPVAEHPIDPISQALGRIEGRFDQFEKRVDDRFRAVDERFATLERYMLWGFGITWTLVIATGILGRLVHG